MADGFEIKFNTPFDKAREAAVRRGAVLPSEYYGKLPKEMRSLSNTISYIQSVEQIQTILDDLKVAIDNGNSFEKWRKNFNPEQFDITKAHAETVYRNALQTQYSVGRWEQAQMAKKTHPYLRYVTINDGRTSQCCSALSGIIRKIDDPFWSSHTPPNHHRCRSIVVSLTEKEAQKRSPAMVGLNQPESPEMQPQKGWDYNPALSHQKQMTDLAKAKIAKLPVGTLQDKAVSDIAKIDSMPLVQQEKFLDDYRKTHSSIVDSVERDLLGIETAKKYGLTHPETVMLNAYTRQGYIDLNKLHNGLETFDEKTTQALENASKILSQALSKLPNFEDTVRRVTNYSPEFLAKHQIDDVVTHGGFTSTTFSEEFVWEDSVRLIIESKTGKDIAKFSPHDEYEILFDKGTKFEVYDRKIVGKGRNAVTELYLTELTK